MDDIFSAKRVLQNALQAIAIRDNFQFKIVKSNNDFLVVQCIVENCQWFLRACRYGEVGNDSWVITRFDSDHTCSLDIVLVDHKDFIKRKNSIDGSQ